MTYTKNAKNTMGEKIKKWINGIRWKYFTNQQAGYTQQAVYDELNMYNTIIKQKQIRRIR